MTALTTKDMREPVIKPEVKPVKTISSDVSRNSSSKGANRWGALVKQIVVIQPFDILNNLFRLNVDPKDLWLA